MGRWTKAAKGPKLKKNPGEAMQQMRKAAQDVKKVKEMFDEKAPIPRPAPDLPDLLPFKPSGPKGCNYGRWGCTPRKRLRVACGMR
jgi:hypothetical protein